MNEIVVKTENWNRRGKIILGACDENENLFEVTVELWHENVRADKATNELYDNTTNIPFPF